MYTLNRMEVHGVCYAIDHVVTGGGNCTAEGKCWYEEVSPTLKSCGAHAVCYALDQQGGKGGANYLKEVCPTILSDSHGTPHAVACIGVDLYNQTTTGGVAMTLTAKRSDPHHVPCVIVLNDQGGQSWK